MKRSLFLWQFAGITFSVVLGTILHFLYDWTNVVFVTPFSAINESTWEHMKIAFFPAFIFAIFEYYFFCKEYPNYWASKFVGILVILILIPSLFYTLSGCFGKTAGWVNILIFFISIGAGFIVEYYLLKSGVLSFKLQWIFLVLICIIAILFIIFSFYPPNLPLFIDPRIKTIY